MQLRAAVAAAIPIVALAAFASVAQPLGPRIENLRVSVSCANYWASPDRGLSVTVDGMVERPVEIDGMTAFGANRYGIVTEWLPSDVAFSIPPGIHRVTFAAPGCTPIEQDLDLQPVMPILVSGRLPVADAALRGPTGAPDGIGIALGAYNLTRGPHTGDYSLFSSSYAYDAATSNGLWWSTSVERGGWVFALDTLFGGGSVSGTASTTEGTGNRGPFPLSGSTYELGGTLRLGARLPMDRLELAAGSGIGGDLWMGGGKVDEPDVAGDAYVANPGLDASWYVPLWAALTYKPSCNWGVQVLASYDIYPTETGEDAPALAAGLLWQPSHACSEPAGLSVR